ncbi:hypothetical protein [Haloarchaeobius amylolyticus]|uniref:hypothetical protein n=1 Tax=Haloarchaeobius amylolyticus TaxID=1198296 RepID=UPI00226FD209|nr:hypothetical protein [Haloarchaeobius amylolyticus]
MALLGIVLAALCWLLAYLHLRYPDALFRIENSLVGGETRLTDRGRLGYRVGGGLFAVAGTVAPSL